MTMPWQPLLEGDLADRAREAVDAIVEDLAARQPEGAEGPSLAGGRTGLALLHGYLAQTGYGPGHAAAAERHLRAATAAVAEQPTSASLYGGLTGVGWAIAHLQGRLPGLDGEDDVAEIDDVLLHHLDRSPWTGDYDLIEGLVGFGVYALERLAPGANAPRPAAVDCLERVVDRLAETAEGRPEGVTWWTDPAWLIPATRAKFTRGYYNVGLAHGVPGVVALLGRVCAAGVAVARARPLLNGAVRWLLAQQRADGFPYWVADEAVDGPGRLAWCYGDAGVTAALLGAARAVDEPDWERQALEVARRAVRRPREQSGVVDVGLCHGAAGLGHLFNRMYQATGDPSLADAARSWLAQALAMRQPGRGVGGYVAWQPGNNRESSWVADPGLLTGSSGIALALLAATTPVEPAWDRMLLLAISPSAAV
jgi:hypothetical protein